jgi:hypothetical protein
MLKFKIFFLTAISIPFIFGCGQAPKSADPKNVTNSKKNPSQLLHDSFLNLDSAVNSHPDDSIFLCCFRSIAVIERESKIEASTDGTFIGRMGFTKNDWSKWHSWYENNFQ